MACLVGPVLRFVIYSSTYSKYDLSHGSHISTIMAPVATEKQRQNDEQLINPFYSPSTADDGNEQYKYAQYKVMCHPWNCAPRPSSTRPSADPPSPFLGAPERG